MHKFLFFIFAIIPFTLVSQNLICCDSPQSVGKSLTGLWKVSDSENNEIFKFQFDGEMGEFWIFQNDESYEKNDSEAVNQKLEIFKTDLGFQIDWSDGKRLVTSRIKTLTSDDLIFVRGDGLETVFMRLPEN